MAEKKYIDAEAFNSAIREAVRRYPNTFYNGLETAQKIAYDFPAADVRPVVKAHWYWDKDGMDWNIGAWRCSACKAMSPMWWNTDRGSPMHKSGHKFCPNCGAWMGENEEVSANDS